MDELEYKKNKKIHEDITTKYTNEDEIEYDAEYRKEYRKARGGCYSAL
jgi:hypothetical protein